MRIAEVTKEELLALQAVYRGCNTNSRIKGAIYVRNPMSPSEREISYYDALNILDKIICEAEKIIEAEVSE